MKEDSIIRNELIKQIDKMFENGVFDHLDCWWGENHSERMADAAMQVMYATIEAQKFMKEENLDPI